MVIVLLFIAFMFIPKTAIAKPLMFQDEKLKGKTVIIHTNDIHGRVLYGQSQSLGILAVAALKELCERQGAEVILLDAGDTLCGSTIANYKQGSSIVELMNIIGYDAMVSGNHDYEYGYRHLLTLAKQMEFPLLGANVLDVKSQDCILKEHVLIQKNGVTYGIFGLVTTSTMTINKEENVEGIQVIDPVVVAQIQVEKLKAEGADVIIALCHVGIKANETMNSLNIIRRVQGIDVLIDGHSHSSLADCMAANSNSEVLYVSTGCHLKAIGVIVIDKDNSKRAYELTELKLYKAGIEAELIGEGASSSYLDKVNRLLEKEKQELPKEFSFLIGKTRVSLVYIPKTLQTTKLVSTVPAINVAFRLPVFSHRKEFILPKSVYYQWYVTSY